MIDNINLSTDDGNPTLFEFDPDYGYIVRVGNKGKFKAKELKMESKTPGQNDHSK